MTAFFGWRHALFWAAILITLFYVFKFTPVFFYLTFLMDVL